MDQCRCEDFLTTMGAPIKRLLPFYGPRSWEEGLRKEVKMEKSYSLSPESEWRKMSSRFLFLPLLGRSQQRYLGKSLIKRLPNEGVWAKNADMCKSMVGWEA